ncbi:Saposin B-type domain-containing protein [Caenorhabditis elegans]|uniref:Saposin B-type domain-containing protein n=1 Tax=Caenorhabditis elegans TaxID=6239 RepID=Q19968_CAEEL|nr:Saposin B-type domain-containing protein [Caenorhabditis elegans]CAA98459.1 Saposin B-type domain-containing protein [Caenorhabditis elegans]|eukprot:NP_505780.1 SaPosin-like Protein family [Caenorhabditis elegans]
MKLIFILSIIFLSSLSVAQSPISCAFCMAGLAQINQQVISSPDMEAQMGIQASQGCDQIPVKQTRETCRGSLNTNFNIFYSNFTGQANNSPTQMCINMGMC